MTSDVSAWLEDLTWPEAKACFDKGMPVVIAIGAAARTHGLHLPLKTDAMIARALAQTLIERLPMIAAPVVSVGLHLSAATFKALLSELIADLHSHAVRRIVILNTDISIETPVDEIASGWDDLLVLHMRALDGADEVRANTNERETSVMLALDPRSVRMDKIAQPADATSATAYKGERILATRVDDVVAAITSRWRDIARTGRPV
jgi:creatinine amidohydrolase